MSQTRLFTLSKLQRSLPLSKRTFAVGAKAQTKYASAKDLKLLRNIGISAHIDSGKTTTTERILFYTGRIAAIHEVSGKDGVGAKMDSMQLEKEKGITIKSAATHTQWERNGNDYHINIIDTPGHVDFTVEVERSLQVLDGAIMLVCGSSGVQSQTLTVDRQMKRYNVPRVIFINKLDRIGVDPFRIVPQIRKELGINAAFVQLPIGLEENHEGVIDLIENKAYRFDGPNGEEIVPYDIPEKFEDQVEEYRMKLLEALGEVDEEMEMAFLEEAFPEVADLKAAIRRQCIAQKFAPVFCGSAFKNKGVQLLVDGVCDYLPSPDCVTHQAIDPAIEVENRDDPANKVDLTTDKKAPLLALAFKIEEGKYGQLTWMKVYQGTLKRGAMIQANGDQKSKKVKVPKIVRLHSEELQDIDEAYAGDICAVFGVPCRSGTTFSDGRCKNVINPMHVPEPVMSYAIAVKSRDNLTKFANGIERFQNEDPTFKVGQDPNSNETIFRGMGELHLDIYIERLRREYGVDCEVGKPRVNYKEVITKRVEFDHTHKKQTGGQGQYGRIIGYIEPLPENSKEEFQFESQLKGPNIPKEYFKSIGKGFESMVLKGPQIGAPIVNLKAVLVDGAYHEVDSSDMAFSLCAQGAFRKIWNDLGPQITEPMMNIEVAIPAEFESTVATGLSKRTCQIDTIEQDQLGVNSTIKSRGPLDQMFGYVTELRSQTQGKGEFSMEYDCHELTMTHKKMDLMEEYKELVASGKEGFERPTL